MKSLRIQLGYAFLLLFLSTSLLFAQQPLPQQNAARYDLTNPRQTVSRHLYYLNNNDGQYNVKLAADALSPSGISQEQREELAVKLKELFDAQGIKIKPEYITDNPLHWDSVYRSNRYTLFPNEFPEIYLVKERGAPQWRYSEASVRSIEVLYNQTIPYATRAAIDIMPDFLKAEFLGLAIWKYLGFLIVIVISVLIFIVLRILFAFLLRRFIIPIISRTTSVNVDLIPPVAKPLSYFVLLIIINNYLVPALILPIGVSRPVFMLLKAVTPYFGIMVLIRFIDVLADIFKKIAMRTDNNMDDQALPIVVKGAKLMLGIFGAIIILSNLEVNVTALLAGISIGGLALALAAQDTVKNFIGSLAIFFDRPFVVGDFIATSSLSGVVTEVGLRSTRIRALDGAQVSIPNGKLVDEIITNHGERSYRRYGTTFGLTYGTPVGTIEKFVEGVREIAIAHPNSLDESVTVQFNEMGSSSLEVFFAVIFNTVEYGDWLKARQDILVDVMKLAESLNVGFAFPSTSVYIEQMPNN
ncbi:MAG: mechanosensitive ion channel family protein [Bacteroidota bacterium]